MVDGTLGMLQHWDIPPSLNTTYFFGNVSTNLHIPGTPTLYIPMSSNYPVVTVRPSHQPDLIPAKKLLEGLQACGFTVAGITWMTDIGSKLNKRQELWDAKEGDDVTF
eukprot:117823-Amphidinium_carterae.1